MVYARKRANFHRLGRLCRNRSGAEVYLHTKPYSELKLTLRVDRKFLRGIYTDLSHRQGSGLLALQRFILRQKGQSQRRANVNPQVPGSDNDIRKCNAMASRNDGYARDITDSPTTSVPRYTWKISRNEDPAQPLRLVLWLTLFNHISSRIRPHVATADSRPLRCFVPYYADA
jgi:hypothetical protein